MMTAKHLTKLVWPRRGHKRASNASADKMVPKMRRPERVKKRRISDVPSLVAKSLRLAEIAAVLSIVVRCLGKSGAFDPLFDSL